MIPFKINKKNWKVIFGYDNDTYGRTIYDTKTITINKESHKEDFRSVLTHELAHAFMWEYGFRQVPFTFEVVCDFMGAYAQEIVKLADYIINVKGNKNE